MGGAGSGAGHLPFPPAMKEGSNLSMSSLMLPSLCLLPATLVGVKWGLMWVFLSRISMVTNDVEHPFVCLLTTHISSLEECLLRFFAHFQNSVVSLFIIIEFLFKISDTCPSPEVRIAHISSRSVGRLSTLFIVPFKAQKVSNLDKAQIVCFFILLLVL